MKIRFKGLRANTEEIVSTSEKIQRTKSPRYFQCKRFGTTKYFCLWKLILPLLTHFLFISLDSLCVQKRFHACRFCALQSSVKNKLFCLQQLFPTITHSFVVPFT